MKNFIVNINGNSEEDARSIHNKIVIASEDSQNTQNTPSEPMQNPLNLPPEEVSHSSFADLESLIAARQIAKVEAVKKFLRQHFLPILKFRYQWISVYILLINKEILENDITCRDFVDLMNSPDWFADCDERLRPNRFQMLNAREFSSLPSGKWIDGGNDNARTRLIQKTYLELSEKFDAVR